MTATDIDTLLADLRAKLEGVRSEKWSWYFTNESDGEAYIAADNMGGLIGAALPWPSEIDVRDYRRVIVNAAYIAAANPQNISVLLAAFDAMRERAETAERKLPEAERQRDAAVEALKGLHRAGRKQGWHNGGYSEEMEAARAIVQENSNEH